MLTEIIAFIGGYLVSKQVGLQPQSVLQKSYERHAKNLGFKKRAFGSDWKEENQYLANRLVTDLVGLKHQEFDESLWFKLDEIAYAQGEDSLVRTYAKVIKLLDSINAIRGGNISLSCAGLLLTTSTTEQSHLQEISPYLKERFDKMEEFLRWNTDLKLADFHNSEMHRLFKMGLVLNIKARWEGKEDW